MCCAGFPVSCRAGSLKIVLPFLFPALSCQEVTDEEVLDASCLLDVLRMYRWQISSFEEQVSTMFKTGFHGESFSLKSRGMSLQWWLGNSCIHAAGRINASIDLAVAQPAGTLLWCFILFYFYPFRAAPEAYGSSQARGWIRAAAVYLRHSHLELCLPPSPQLTATPDP